jgi:hypothetical protein
VRLNSDATNQMLVKALVALVPVSMLLVYSVAVLVTRKTLPAVLQLVVQRAWSSWYWLSAA